MTFSERYPEKAPRVRFTSEMFHPNVSGGGGGGPSATVLVVLVPALCEGF